MKFRSIVVACWTLLLSCCMTAPVHAQVNAGALLPDIIPTFHNASGVAPASLGFLCTYAAGTTNVLYTYQDSALTTQNQDPVRLNAAGRPVNGSTEVSVFLQPLAYKAILYAAGTGNTCNGVTVGTAIRTVDNVYDFAQLYSGQKGTVTMTHDASGAWTAYKPDGSILSTAGDNCQGLQTAVTYAATNQYELLVYGGFFPPGQASKAIITCTTGSSSVGLSFPAGQGLSFKVVGLLNLIYSSSCTSGTDFITFDSLDLSDLDFGGVQVIDECPGSGASVHILPTSPIVTAGFVGMTSSRLSFGHIIPALSNGTPDPTRRSAFQVTGAANAIVANDIYIREVQGGLYGIKIDSPTGSPSTGFELNRLVLPQIHNIGTAAIQIGTSATNASHVSGNQWTAIIGTVSGTATAIDTYGVNDGFTVSVRGGTGVVVESSASGNVFNISGNGTSTPWTDNSTAKNNIRIDSQQAKWFGSGFAFNGGQETIGALYAPSSADTKLVLHDHATLTEPSVSGLTPIAHLVSAAATAETFLWDSFATNNSLLFRRADGTLGSPSAVQNNEDLGHLAWAGYGATGYTAARGSIEAHAAQTWTDSNQGTRLALWTTANGTTTPVSRMTINDAGSVVFDTQCGSGTFGNCMIPNAGVVVTVSGSTSLTAPSVSSFTTPPLFHFVDCDSCAQGVLLDSFQTNGFLYGRRADGTLASPTAVQSGETLFQVGGAGYAATAGYVNARAAVTFAATENWTNTNQGAKTAFFATINGSTTPTEYVDVDNTATIDILTGGSTTISTGVGSIRLSTVNSATNTVWIPIAYNGTKYYVPGYATNAP